MPRDESALDQLKKLNKERDGLLSKARSEALENAKEAVKVLKELGLEYSLVEGKSQSVKGSLSDKPCDLCGFGTSPPHDKRKHRWVLGFEDTPFTASKLRELNLTKV